MAKNSVESNFDKLKKQMMKKRDRIDGLPDDTEKKTSDFINTNENGGKDENENRNEYVNTSENTNNSANGNVNNYTNVNVNNYTNKNENSSQFVLRVEKKEETLRRQTYYLKETTIKKIDGVAGSSGVGKSELVQRILEEALKNLKIVKAGDGGDGWRG